MCHRRHPRRGRLLASVIRWLFVRPNKSGAGGKTSWQIGCRSGNVSPGVLVVVVQLVAALAAVAAGVAVGLAARRVAKADCGPRRAEMNQSSAEVN